MSAPLPEGTLHLLVADKGVTEGRWYGEYLTLCHALVPASGLPPSLCPDGCDQEHRFCPQCVREAARWSAEVEQPEQDARVTR